MGCHKYKLIILSNVARSGVLLGVSSVSRTLSRKLATFCHPIYRVSIFGAFMRIWLFFFII